jgi:DNA-binding MarR family transcriptional regulator
MNDPLSKLPGYLLRRASSSVAVRLAGMLTPLDLRMVDVSILLWIEANPGITQSEICRALDIQRANMAPIAARLSQRGLVERQPVDGRSQGLALTEAGLALAAEARILTNAFEAELTARVPEALRVHIVPILTALWVAE